MRAVVSHYSLGCAADPHFASVELHNGPSAQHDHCVRNWISVADTGNSRWNRRSIFFADSMLRAKRNTWVHRWTFLYIQRRIFTSSS
jgi:hypothetical protein